MCVYWGPNLEPGVGKREVCLSGLVIIKGTVSSLVLAFPRSPRPATLPGLASTKVTLTTSLSTLYLVVVILQAPETSEFTYHLVISLPSSVARLS